MSGTTIGIIGGSGLYDIQGLEDVRELELSTPFGAPSDALITGTYRGTRLVFLPRHGRGHRIAPNEINFRANVWALKKAGVSRIVSVSAVGSMREDIHPGDFVVIDQFFDRTRHRADTFFGNGVVAHVLFADPVCPEVRAALLAGGKALGLTMHDGGTYLNMEGPQFSTRAESRIYRQWSVDVIRMTNLQEAKLAREAEIAYATVALPTDYDCWHETEADVDVAAVVRVLLANGEKAKRVIVEVARRMSTAAEAISCRGAMEHAFLSSKDAISADARRRLAQIAGQYLG